MSNLSTLPKGDSAWLLRKAIERIMEQVSVLETNIGSSTTGNSANTQIIFNDNGTLRGDAGLVYNKTTDALTVAGLVTAGSAAITGAATVGTTLGVTGDLTVATDAFKVISATKDVCIGTVTPTFNNKLTVVGGAGGDAFITSGNGTRTGYIGTDGTHVIMGGYSNHSVQIHANDIAQMRIAPLGVFEWFDGASGTRMTLNATGLGIGVSPATKLDVRSANNASQATFSGTASRGLLISTRSDGLADDRTVILNAQHSTGSLGQLVIQTAGTDRLLVDSSGNLGIGVTPSAWTNQFIAIEGGDSNSQSAVSFQTNANAVNLHSNSYYSSGYKYKFTGTAGQYALGGNQHEWYIAPSGTAGDAITFTQAMTLDASGNLLVGTTSLLGTERLIVTKTTVGSYLARFINTNTTVDTFGITVKYSASAPNDASHNFLYVEDNVNVRAQIYANGGLANYSANNVNLSDARTKTDIKPLTSYWNKIKALELVTFKYKDQTHDDNNIGLISQQVESVAPEFVSNEGFGETPADGVPLKSIYTTDLYHAAIKALQEAMTRIEVLESKLA